MLIVVDNQIYNTGIYMYGGNNYFQIDDEFTFFWYLVFLFIIPSVSLMQFNMCYWHFQFGLFWQQYQL